MEKLSKRRNVKGSKSVPPLSAAAASTPPAAPTFGVSAPGGNIVRDTSSLDPLPRNYLTEGEGIGGRIKVRPEDFLVDEQPLYQLCGRGEHLYLLVEKRNVSHVEMMAALRKRFGVANMAIGFAGMKDKVGITRQLVSIHLPHSGGATGRPRGDGTFDLGHDRIAILWADRHTNKIKRGHLAGNRFSIRIREVDPLHAPRAMRTLRILERLGVPNFFGAQRFGYRNNNHVLGAMLLAGECQSLLDELLGTRGTPFPEYQRERRELFDQGRYEEALAMWTPADASERSALRALTHGRSVRRAAYAPGTTTWGFWIAAMQSAAFNRVLDRRLEDGMLDRLVEGDLAWKHATRGLFAIDAGLAQDEEIRSRLDRLEISPTGPLWGARLTRPAAGSAIAEVEEEALACAGFTPDSLAAARDCPDGSRRPLREPIRNMDVDSGIDEHGPYIRVAFDLPRGVYATIALREIMKAPVDEAM